MPRHRLVQRHQVLGRRVGLHVVDGVEDEAAAVAEDLDPLAHLAADLVRRAEGQRLLRVDAAAPEGEPLAEAAPSASAGPCRPPSTAPG